MSGPRRCGYEEEYRKECTMRQVLYLTTALHLVTDCFLRPGPQVPTADLQMG